MKINENTKSALYTLLKGVLACVITFIGSLIYKEVPDITSAVVPTAIATSLLMS